MRRAFPVVLAAALALTCAACRSTPDAPPVPSSGDASGAEKIRFGTPAESSSSTGPGALDYIASPFETIIWWPWKILGTGLKGAADGVGAGFTKERMPVVGIIVSPINLVAGFVTGLAEGAAMGPASIGPSDRFGRTMSMPTKHATTIWWY